MTIERLERNLRDSPKSKYQKNAISRACFRKGAVATQHGRSIDAVARQVIWQSFEKYKFLVQNLFLKDDLLRMPLGLKMKIPKRLWILYKMQIIPNRS